MGERLAVLLGRCALVGLVACAEPPLDDVRSSADGVASGSPSSSGASLTPVFRGPRFAHRWVEARSGGDLVVSDGSPLAIKVLSDGHTLFAAEPSASVMSRLVTDAAGHRGYLWADGACAECSGRTRRLVAIDLADGTSRELFTDPGLEAFTVDGDALFWTAASGRGAISVAQRDLTTDRGGEELRFGPYAAAGDHCEVVSMIADAEFVYLAESCVAPLSLRIVRLGRASGAFEHFPAKAGVKLLGDLVADDAALYYVTGTPTDPSATAYALDKRTLDERIVSRALRGPIAEDGASLYFVLDGAVAQVGKRGGGGNLLGTVFAPEPRLLPLAERTAVLGIRAREGVVTVLTSSLRDGDQVFQARLY